jgi:D-alanyl-D-alanine carboxypeptidase
MSTRQWMRIWTDLGIDESLLHSCKLDLQTEAKDLVSAGLDVFNREQFVTHHTLVSWQNMKAAAEQDGIDLLLVSAFRSVEYQCQLIRKKLENGQSIEEIVKVSAIPGYSEHHTGRALDLTTIGAEPLEEGFELTGAFNWLCTHASHHHFVMSYPRGNAYDMVYEPWHWTYQGER